MRAQWLGFCGTDPSPSRIAPAAVRVLVKSPMLLRTQGSHLWKLTPAHGLKVSACRRSHPHDSHCPGSHDSCRRETHDCPCRESIYRFVGLLGVACGITSAAASALVETHSLPCAHCDARIIMTFSVCEFLSSCIHRLQRPKQGKCYDCCKTFVGLIGV